MNSVALKTAVLCWLRFGRRYPYVCTEVGRFSADVVGATGETLVEVEVKISIADLKNDFRNKNKHKFYTEVDPVLYRGATWIPNTMYFCVPERLKDFTLEYLQVQNPKYGVLVFKEDHPNGHNLECVKKAQKLHTVPPKPKILENILLRMGSELTNFHIYSHAYANWLRDMKDKARHLSEAIDIDPETVVQSKEGEINAEGTK